MIDPLGYDESDPATIMSAADRDYCLDWMFIYAANPDPAQVCATLGYPPDTQGWNAYSDFRDPGGFMNYPKFYAYVQGGTNYKLVNHFQVKYRVNLANPTQFNGAPTAIEHDTLVGVTVNPTGIPPLLPPIAVSVMDDLFGLPAASAYNQLLNAQYGPADGKIGIDPNSTYISQINDGSPDLFGIRAFNTLEALDTPNPVFWNNIGSKITFTCGNTGPGNLPPQVYPTYYRYINGIYTNQWAQATSPTGNFTANPYPFGTVPSYGQPPDILGAEWVLHGYIPLPTIPGGRNGDGTSHAMPKPMEAVTPVRARPTATRRSRRRGRRAASRRRGS